MYKLVGFIILMLLSANIYSQENKEKVEISDERVIVGNDTLVIGITRLEDILSQEQIDSLGRPIISHWDGDCDSGTDYEYWIKGKDYDAVFVKNKQGKFLLSTISIQFNKLVSITIFNHVLNNNLSSSELNKLELRKDYNYRKNDSTLCYRKEGISLILSNNEKGLILQSMHIHPKSWDKYLKLRSLKGNITNKNKEALPGTTLLAYTKTDSLKYYEVSDFDGYFNFDVNDVIELDVLNVNSQTKTIRVNPKKSDQFNISLDFQRYKLPDLIIKNKKKFEYDTSCVIDQFPKLRDSTKINVWLSCEFVNFNPLIYKIPQPQKGYDQMYSELVEDLQEGKRLKDCQAEVHFVIKKDGHISLEKIEASKKINKEKLARSVSGIFHFTPLTWRGRRCNSYWKLRIIFE